MKVIFFAAFLVIFSSLLISCSTEYRKFESTAIKVVDVWTPDGSDGGRRTIMSAEEESNFVKSLKGAKFRQTSSAEICIRNDCQVYTVLVKDTKNTLELHYRGNGDSLNIIYERYSKKQVAENVIKQVIRRMPIALEY